MMVVLAVKLEERLLDSLFSRYVLKAGVEWGLNVVSGNDAVEHHSHKEGSL